MKKRAFGFIRAIVIIAAVLASALLPAPLLDRLFLPWAFEHPDHPALTGNWVGSLATSTGRPYGVVLQLWLPEPAGDAGLVRDWRSAPYGELEGTARVCDEHGVVHSYTVAGEPENRQATSLDLCASRSESPAPEGLALSWIRGVWDRADKLDLSVQFYWERDGAAISGAEFPETQAEALLAMAAAARQSSRRSVRVFITKIKIFLHWYQEIASRHRTV